MDGCLPRIVSFAGLFVMMGLAWLMSEGRRRISLRTVGAGLLLQLVFALLVLKTDPGQRFFEGAERAFGALLAASNEGAGFLFGELVKPELKVEGRLEEHLLRLGAVVAFQVLPIVIFFSALAGVLYHLGVTQLVVRAMARVMQKAMNTSGAESLAAALFVFLGIEATTAIIEYIRRMTRSELFTLMAGFMATIAGSVMGAYVAFGVSAGHLLAASVMSAPAAIAIAKIMVPETEEPLTRGRVHFQPPREAVNVIDAAARGAGQGLGLALNIGAMLIAFVGLIALANLILGALTDPQIVWGGWGVEYRFAEKLTLQRIFGWAFSPLAIAMGVTTWSDAAAVGQLLGTRLVINEFVAYQQMSGMAAAGAISPRAAVIATYALCGFANFGSVAILIGGLGAIDPERKGLIARLGVRSLIAGLLASFMTACFAGILV
ncbi:MAG: NupC/NupG family nucleoside CNT transporter [Planctomycetes bacterium]|nr:NupC/NupG family nucleoside CNT transporter [Planctomycetota bacterium]